MSCHPFLAWRVSIERSAVILMGIPLCVICCFSLAAFSICPLYLILVNLINMCLGVFCLGFILFGTLWVSWTWVIISFPILGKFWTIISSSIFSWSFFLSSSSGTPMIRMLGHLTLSWRSLRLSSFLLIRFSFFLSDSFISTILSSTSLILFSPPGHLCLLPPPSFLHPTLCISLCVPDGGEHLGNWLLGGSVSLLLIPPIYPQGHLCLLPPSSLLFITLWTSLSGPDCGTHIRK